MVSRQDYDTGSVSASAPSVGSKASTSGANADEARLHREAEAGVRLKAQRLRRALDADKLDDAVRIAADIAAELRSPAAAELSPRSYYDVYLAVASELRLLEIYVSELARRGAPVLTLYERVQETPLVLPRLYLLITAGSVYVKSMQAPARDVLRDLVEMCAGVQHPQRGLFLRAFLSQMMKDKLPDINNQFGAGAMGGDSARVTDVGSGSVLASDDDQVSGIDSAVGTSEERMGDVRDSIDFILRNFTEMNRLWVRMQHDCAPNDISRRQRERSELRLLVGSNISTLARLEGVDLPMYKTTVLPAVLDQIISCHDAMAQEYLADCVAQVFPDDFQLATLHQFLTMCGQLVPGVNLKVILVSVVDRLTRYASQSEEAATQVRQSRAFDMFRDHIPVMVMRQKDTLSYADCVRVYLSLMKFTLTSEPDALDHVDYVLGLALETARDASVTSEDGGVVSQSLSPQHDARLRSNLTSGEITGESPTRSQPLNEEEEDLLVRLLSLPIDTHRSISAALSFSNFGRLQLLLRYHTRQKLAVKLLQSVAVYKRCISEVSVLHRLLDYVKCLAEDPAHSQADRAHDSPEGSRGDDGMFDISSLSSHHSYVLSAIPGAAYYSAPGDTVHAASSNPGAAAHGNHVRFANDTLDRAECGTMEDGASDLAFGIEQVDSRDFVRGQELVSRIVYFCDDVDLGMAYSLHVALRDRLRRGGEARSRITLPPLVMSVLRLSVRAGAALRSVPTGNAFELTRKCLHFAFETTAYLRLSSPESSLRLHLQIAAAAAEILRQMTSMRFSLEKEGFDLEVLQQYAYENLSRSFEVFETGVVSGKCQFVALELIIGYLVQVRIALEPGVYNALALRAVKHSRQLLTKSDQCLALCACADLFWVADRGVYSEKEADEERGERVNGSESGSNNWSDGQNIHGRIKNSSLKQFRDAGAVAMCMDDALDAARGCMSDGERVLLLMDIAHRLLKLIDMDCMDAADGGRLDELFRLSGSLLDERRVKGSAVGRAAVTRLNRLRKYVRAHPNEYSSLALKHV